MNNEENPSIQAPGQAVDNPTRIAALTTLAREIGPGAFRGTFSFEAR
jgi:hypothetical protein